MIIYLSDLHLTRWTWLSRKDIEGDSFRALKELENIIKAQASVVDEETAVILGGDVFDTAKVDGPTLEAFASFVDGLFESGIDVHFIQGNHDRNDIPIAEVQGAHSLHKKLVTLAGATVYGLDWAPKEEIQAALKEVPPCDYLVLHGMMQHLVNFEAAADFKMEDIPAHVKNVLVGDIHVTACHTLPDLRGFCVSSGSLVPCTVKEAGQKYMAAISANGSLTWLPIPTREIVRFDVRAQDKFDMMVSTLPDIQARGLTNYEPIIDIVYTPELSEAVNTLPTLYTGLKFFLKTVAAGKLLGSQDLLDAQKDFREMSMELSLHTLVDPVGDRRLHEFLLGCLKGQAKLLVKKEMEACV